MTRNELKHLPFPSFRDQPEYHDKSARRRITKNLPEYYDMMKAATKPGSGPVGIFKELLLKRPQEVHLFHQMNCLKYMANTARERRFRDACVVKAREVRGLLISLNTRLCASTLKRIQHNPSETESLLSLALESLIRAVDAFNVAKGNRFSTYGCWAIWYNVRRGIGKEMSGIETYGVDPPDQDAYEEQNEFEISVLQGILKNSNVTPRELQILLCRHEIDHEFLTLKNIGKNLGVSKERVRQIYFVALEKLRDYAAEHYPEYMECA